MTTETQTTPTIEQGLSAFVDNLNTATVFLTEKLVEASPKAVEVMLIAVRLQGLTDMVFALVYGLIAFFMGKYTVGRFSKAVEENDETLFFCGTGGLAVTVLFAIATFVNFSTGNLIAAISPEAFLALKALNAAGL